MVTQAAVSSVEQETRWFRKQTSTTINRLRATEVNLVSIILYGSAAAGIMAGQSD